MLDALREIERAKGIRWEPWVFDTETRNAAERFAKDIEHNGLEASIMHMLDDKTESQRLKESRRATVSRRAKGCLNIFSGCFTLASCFVKFLEFDDEILLFGGCQGMGGECVCVPDSILLKTLLLILLGLIIGGLFIYNVGPNLYRFLWQLAQGLRPAFPT